MEHLRKFNEENSENKHLTVGDLKKLLEKYPDDMSIWVSDGGNSEGGTRLEKVEKVLASDAGLDGDDIDDEYFFIEDDTDIKTFLKNGYILNKDKDMLSKEILYLND